MFKLVIIKNEGCQIWDKALSAAEIKESMGDLKKGASVNPAVALATTWGNIKY